MTIGELKKTHGAQREATQDGAVADDSGRLDVEQVLEVPYSNGEAVSDMVSREDGKALRVLLDRVRRLSWKTPPFDEKEKESAALEHLWSVVLKKAQGDARPDGVLQAALAGKFDFVPYEVANRLIDDARKASAQKRGGDGEHVPLFDALTGDGEPERTQADQDQDEPQPRRPPDSRIEHKRREVWLRMTYDIRREELGSHPVLDQLGPEVKLYRFHLEHEDDGYTDAEIAHELGMTDRTIRNYRQKLSIVRHLL